MRKSCIPAGVLFGFWLDDDPALPELAFEDEGEGEGVDGWSPLLFTGGAETFLPVKTRCGHYLIFNVLQHKTPMSAKGLFFCQRYDRQTKYDCISDHTWWWVGCRGGGLGRWVVWRWHGFTHSPVILLEEALDVWLIVPALVAGAVASELLVLDHPKLLAVVEPERVGGNESTVWEIKLVDNLVALSTKLQQFFQW